MGRIVRGEREKKRREGDVNGVGVGEGEGKGREEEMVVGVQLQCPSLSILAASIRLVCRILTVDFPSAIACALALLLPLRFAVS